MDEQKTAASIDKQYNENSKTSISKEDDIITVMPFVKKAMDMLDQYSPFWRNCEPETTKTLNYPACLDVLENRVRVIDVKTSSNTAGQKGEDFVSALFQRLNHFGIIIAGFDSEQFYCKLMKESKKQILSFARKALTVLCNEIKEVYNSRCFECDFLFFHPKKGLTIVEVKARERVEDAEDETLEKAKDQLNKIIQSRFFPRLAEIFSGRELLLPGLPIRGAIFFPCADLSHIKTEWKESYELMDINQADQNAFNNYWSKNVHQETDIDFHFNDYLPLIATLIGYRSVVHISACHSILEVHKMILEGTFYAKNSKQQNGVLPLDEQYDGAIFLTPEQLSISECTSKIQVIYGPPGTGKTLLLLLKALRRLKSRFDESTLIKTGNGSVIVEAVSETLVRKFRNYFDAHIVEPYRNEITVAVYDSLWSTRERMPEKEDDYFCDECDEQEQQKICKWRRNAVGITVVIVTGNILSPFVDPFPASRVRSTLPHGMTDDVASKSEISVFRLYRSLRGTGNIIDYWKKYFRRQELKKSIAVGHCISGAVVEETIVAECEVAQKVTVMVKAFLEGAGCMKPKDIAIIHYIPAVGWIVKKVMEENGIRCGTVEEQLEDENLVAVDAYDKTVSLEWPIVIVIVYQAFSDLIIAIAASRAIAHLSVVKYQDDEQTFDDYIEGGSFDSLRSLWFRPS